MTDEKMILEREATELGAWNAGWNAALEWVAGWLEAGHPMPGDKADPRAVAMTIRAGRRSLRWEVEVHYQNGDPDGSCINEQVVEAVDEATACEIAEAEVVGSRFVARVDDVRAGQHALAVTREEAP